MPAAKTAPDAGRRVSNYATGAAVKSVDSSRADSRPCTACGGVTFLPEILHQSIIIHTQAVYIKRTQARSIVQLPGFTLMAQ